MSLAPLEGYHRTRSSGIPCDPVGAATTVLSAGGEAELADARLTTADRQFVRRVLAFLEPRLSDEALMFLSGGAEHAARRKQARKATR